MKTKTGSASKSGAATKNGSSQKSGSASRSTSNGSSGSANGSNGSRSSSNGSSKSSANGSSRSKSEGVKAKSDAASGLSELFEEQLQDIYWAEKALTKALPKMSKNATSPELKACIDEHLAVTQEQITRLEEVFSVIGKPAKAKKCEAMAGLIKEGEEIMEGTEKGVVRDAGIIAASQKVEHYEIASYGTLAAFAKTLGETEAADLLNETLAEEKEADQTLTQVAESTINIEAAEDDEDEEEEDEDEDDEEEEQTPKSKKK